MLNRLLPALALAAAAGCARAAYEVHEGHVEVIDRDANAEMRLADGTRIGTLRLTETAGGGVRVTGSLTGVTPSGLHGFHVHDVGQCDPPSFESAGGHFNPFGFEHGLENARGQHAGDAPNVQADAMARVSVDVLLSHASLSQGPHNLLDANGSAVIIHAQPDDQRTNPSGNSGARIACGVVIRRGS